MYNSTYYYVRFWDVNDVKRDLSNCQLLCENWFAGGMTWLKCYDNLERRTLNCYDHKFDWFFWLAPIYQTAPENIYLIDYETGAILDYCDSEGDYYDILEGVEIE